MTMPDASAKPRFTKPFTQQEALNEDIITRVGNILRTGRLHRYNTAEGETSEVALLEQEYADWQDTPYCLAVTSGGQAMQIAMRAVGIKPGDKIVANAYTLAPVPGAIHAVGAVPVFVEIDNHWHIDLADLEAKAKASGARFLMLSHMRGHLVDMDAIMRICDAHKITLIEDCAHTMGARWKGTRSGNFGAAACFSTQTYKHMNSGEGGFLTTADPLVAARAVMMSGSYMLYERHGARPPAEAFDQVKLDMPNCSARMDNLRAALLRGQMAGLDDAISRWNARYRVLERGLRASSALILPRRVDDEYFVGSSIQFQATGVGRAQVPELVRNCAARGVEIKWFGAPEPAGFTSRFDSWRYFGAAQELPHTQEVLGTTCDLRIPLTFSEDDCALIATIIVEEADQLAAARSAA